MTQRFAEAVNTNILSEEKYFRIDTGIEHRFNNETESVHQMLYNSLGPTTDLLRYFPDALYFDRYRRLPTWELNKDRPRAQASAASKTATGLFTFFVEFKYSGTERRAAIGNVPTEYIGQIEREAWLTYKRLTSPNPYLGIYLDGLRTRIALFYAAPYAPQKIYAGWEEDIEPIAVRRDIAQAGARTIETKGSGTPWINFDIRQLKPLANFLVDDLSWKGITAVNATRHCKDELFSE